VNQGLTPVPDPFEAPLAGLHGDAAVRRRLATYASLLYERNACLNLTGARTPAEIAEQIRDSLTVLPYVREPMIDIGSGGGFPGVPLAVATGWEVTLVESIAKKARFLEEVADRLGVSLRVVTARAEELARDAAYRERFASATVRAVGSAPTVLELAVPFLALGGRAVLQRGAAGPREREAIAQAGLILGAELVDEVLLEADGPDGVGRRILLFEKRTATPARFPRRSGVAAKRPLHSSRLRPADASPG
jgi:16S rRNA (guanine527-N7)-methyltransferase